MLQKRTKIQQEKVLKALEGSLGVVTTALKNSDITRQTYYRWLREDEEFANKVDEIENMQLDFIKSKYYECIKDKIPSVVIHAAKTRLGWNETNNVDITTKGEKINDDRVVINFKGTSEN
jgi:hypothetical protein